MNIMRSGETPSHQTVKSPAPVPPREKDYDAELQAQKKMIEDQINMLKNQMNQNQQVMQQKLTQESHASHAEFEQYSEAQLDTSMQSNP